jgi:hypothetical protein
VLTTTIHPKNLRLLGNFGFDPNINWLGNTYLISIEVMLDLKVTVLAHSAQTPDLNVSFSPTQINEALIFPKWSQFSFNLAISLGSS